MHAEGGVAALAFTSGGDRLASLGGGRQHTLGLWDWRNGVCIATAAVATEPLFGVACAPDGGGGGTTIATAGARSLKLWRLDGSSLKLWRRAELSPAKPGVAGGGGGVREPTLCCVAYLRSGLLIAGTSRGEIWSWAAGGELVSRLRVHAGPVFALQCHPDRFSDKGEAERRKAEAQFKELGDALEILTHPLKRRLWDEGHDVDSIAQQMAMREQQQGRQP